MKPRHWLHKLHSRKLWAWLVGTAIYAYPIFSGGVQVMDGWQWLGLTTIFLGSNSIDKIIALRRAAIGGA